MKYETVLFQMLDLIEQALKTPTSQAAMQAAIASEFDKQREKLSSASPELIEKLETIKKLAIAAEVPANPEDPTIPELPSVPETPIDTVPTPLPDLTPDVPGTGGTDKPAEVDPLDAFGN